MLSIVLVLVINIIVDKKVYPDRQPFVQMRPSYCVSEHDFRSDDPRVLS